MIEIRARRLAGRQELEKVKMIINPLSRPRQQILGIEIFREGNFINFYKWFQSVAQWQEYELLVCRLNDK